MTRGHSISSVRSGLYAYARLLGDVQALASGNPNRIARRLANKWLGRNVVRRLWR
jgi:hypothetical protein